MVSKRKYEMEVIANDLREKKLPNFNCSDSKDLIELETTKVTQDQSICSSLASSFKTQVPFSNR